MPNNINVDMNHVGRSLFDCVALALLERLFMKPAL